MSLAILGWGSTFATGDGNSPETFTTFGEVSAIGGPQFAVDVIDTSHEQPPQSARESLPGFRDAGEIQIDFNFIPGSSSTTALMAELSSGVTRNRRVNMPGGRRWNFQAYCTGFETRESVGDKLTGSAKFKISGMPTLT